MPDSFMGEHRAEVTSLAARYRLPAISPYRFYTELGGLLSYGVDLTDNFRRAATYADRIPKGAKPNELPVQAPVKFELVINLKTAKALGLDVPLQLQQRADEVMEQAYSRLLQRNLEITARAASGHKPRRRSGPGASLCP
jgi:putative tryptophan/tyrosine transport system substrate-binding protein